MAKWKCEICRSEFDNFHAQGFDNKIYCPLCFFKKENQELKRKIAKYEDPEDLTLMFMYCDEKAKSKIKELKKQIDYLRSNEYLTQLKFERDILQDIVDNGEVLEEDKEFIDMTHRNTELLEENEDLKKQLEAWEQHLKCSKEMLDIQAQKGNYDYDEYMLGLYNGMEYIISLFEKREPNYINGKDIEFTNNKTQQKEFINYLEDEINSCTKQNDIFFVGMQRAFKLSLQKYKEIIGG